MADTAMLKEMNLKKIREVLSDGRSISKTALAEITGLSFPTVGKFVDELVKSHEVLAMGAQSSSGGRCSRVYQYNPDYRNVMGMILEGRHIDWFVLDSLGMTKNQGQLEVGDDVVETLAVLLQTARRREPSLYGFVLGIAANTKNGTIQISYEYPELQGVPLLKLLEEASGLKGEIGNDMEFSAEGSGYRLHLSDRSLISFYLGKCGFGSSFVFHGKVLQGAHHLAGEIELLPWIQAEKLNQDSPAGPLPQAVIECLLTYAVITDPNRILLYSHPCFAASWNTIIAGLKTCFGEDIPEVLLSDHFRIDYEIGLSRRALALMMEGKD